MKESDKHRLRRYLHDDAKNWELISFFDESRLLAPGEQREWIVRPDGPCIIFEIEIRFIPYSILGRFFYWLCRITGFHKTRVLYQVMTHTDYAKGPHIIGIIDRKEYSEHKLDPPIGLTPGESFEIRYRNESMVVARCKVIVNTVMSLKRLSDR